MPFGADAKQEISATPSIMCTMDGDAHELAAMNARKEQHRRVRSVGGPNRLATPRGTS
jgi:hypothetical protein